MTSLRVLLFVKKILGRAVPRYDGGAGLPKDCKPDKIGVPESTGVCLLRCWSALVVARRCLSLRQLSFYY
jgi:hypothetical protein